MIYEFEELEIEYANEKYSVSGTMEVDECEGFGEWNEDVDIGNIKISYVIDNEGNDILHSDDIFIHEVTRKFVEDFDFYDKVQEAYFSYMTVF